ncbi:hypothetical protein E2C01_090064 [Portunus trituberculatus]|uniref:Uncharacterized protein n=1 Tax=Portunus trituberculatus TaxID=210409 RepID=A0A5B7JJX4_PORTR|nr:hypothetical protein [Portunus trituberculatus]
MLIFLGMITVSETHLLVLNA